MSLCYYYYEGIIVGREVVYWARPSSFTLAMQLDRLGERVRVSPHLIWGEALEDMAGAHLWVVLHDVGEGDAVCTCGTAEYGGVRVSE